MSKNRVRCRIIKRTECDGTIRYVIQQKHFLFWWVWVSTWVYSSYGARRENYFDSLDEAKYNLCYFDGTKAVVEVIE